MGGTAHGLEPNGKCDDAKASLHFGDCLAQGLNRMWGFKKIISEEG